LLIYETERNNILYANVFFYLLIKKYGQNQNI
jgi:hypothetical protein